MAEAPEKLEQMIATFEAALDGRANFALGVVGLAETVAERGDKLRAYALCRKALASETCDAEATLRVRRLLATFIGGYHVPMMNDARRNSAWDAALRRAISPGTVALEIGAGAGMLAMMAARAGARQVVTCERDPVLASIATEIIAHNGFASRVEVVPKASVDLKLGADLDQPADLLFCDIFGDGLFDFKPLAALSDARRLLRPGAPVIPAFGSLHVALAHWALYPVSGHVDRAAGFDLGAFRPFTRAWLTVPVGSEQIALRSTSAQPFRFDFAAESHPSRDSAIVTLEASDGGEANGVLQWIKLELDAETTLESRPQPGAQFFSACRFWPFDEPLSLVRGDVVRVAVSHDQRQLTILRCS